MKEITFFDADKKGNINIHEKALTINIVNLALNGTLKIYQHDDLILMLVTTIEKHILGIYSSEDGFFIEKVETDFVDNRIPKQVIAARLFDYAKNGN